MNKYEVLGVAGEGAYGVVHKCREKATGKLVAIKKFREPDEDDEEAKRFAAREIKILRSLKHEHIIEMREAFRKEGLLHLVFEYVESSVLDLLELHPAGLGAEAARPLTRQLARALQHCHSHGVLHRDIKPDNLLICAADNSLKLCDFGSACKQTTLGAVLTDYVATRWYRAPELLVRSNNYGKAADMWALGCVMVELTTGQPLFAGKSDIDQLNLIHEALGALTPEQFEKCMNLTHAADLRMAPKSAGSAPLRPRFGGVLGAEQLQLLEMVAVMEPSQRLTAAAALRQPWLQDVQDSRQAKPRPARDPPPRSVSSSPEAQVLSARPPKPVCRQVSPRAEQVLSSQETNRGGSQGGMAAPPRAAAVGIAPARRPAEPVEEPLESVASFTEDASCKPRAQGTLPSPRACSPLDVEDLCEESIPEEIHTPRAIPEIQEEVQAEPAAAHEAMSHALQFRARSSPPPVQRIEKPLGQLVKRTRPASSKQAPGSILRLES